MNSYKNENIVYAIRYNHNSRNGLRFISTPRAGSYFTDNSYKYLWSDHYVNVNVIFVPPSPYNLFLFDCSNIVNMKNNDSHCELVLIKIWVVNNYNFRIATRLFFNFGNLCIESVLVKFHCNHQERT